MRKKWIFILALAGVLALAGGCKAQTEDKKAEASEEVLAGDLKSKVVKLGKYKGIEVEAVNTEVTEEDVQAEIDALLKAYPETRPIEGKTSVAEGDVVNIDYIGRMDGEAFEGGTSPEGGYNLTIGSNSFIPGFEDGLIGKETGKTYDLPLTFPDPYKPNPDMSGKEAVFEVTVNAIVEYVDPEWTDAFVQKYTGYESIDEYMMETRAVLEEIREQSAKEQKEYNVIQALIADTEFAYDEGELENLKNAAVREYENYASYYEMELSEFLSYFMNGMTEEQFKQQAEELARFQLENQLVIRAVAEAEGISLTEEEYQEGLANLATQFQAESPEAFQEQHGRELIEESLIYDKTIDFLAEQAVEI